MQGTTCECEQMPHAMKVWNAVECEEDGADGVSYTAENQKKKCVWWKKIIQRFDGGQTHPAHENVHDR